MQFALLIFVVSYIAIIAHDGNKTVLIEFGRYIQTLGVLLWHSSCTVALVKLPIFTIPEDFGWLGCEEGALAFLYPVSLFRRWFDCA